VGNRGKGGMSVVPTRMGVVGGRREYRVNKVRKKKKESWGGGVFEHAARYRKARQAPGKPNDGGAKGGGSGNPGNG